MTLLSQPEVTLLPNSEFTTTGLYYKFHEHGNVLKRGIVDEYGTDDRIGANGGIGLHFRATKRFAFETGYALTHMDLEVHDQKFLDTNNLGRPRASRNYNNDWPARDAQFDIWKYYHTGYFQIYFFTNPSSAVTPYFSAGIAKSFLGSKQSSGSASFEYSGTGEHQTLTASFSRQYVSGLIETGFLWGNGRHSDPWSVFTGINLHIAGRMVSGDYSNTGGPQSYTDHASSTGSYLSISLRIGYTLGYIKHTERESSIHDEYHPLKSKPARQVKKAKRPHQKQRGPAFKGFKNKKSKPGSEGLERSVQRTDN